MTTTATTATTATISVESLTAEFAPLMDMLRTDTVEALTPVEAASWIWTRREDAIKSLDNFEISFEQYAAIKTLLDDIKASVEDFICALTNAALASR